MSETTTEPDAYLHFDGMTWPNPAYIMGDEDLSGLIWRLRYGTPTRQDLLVAASAASAYVQLVDLHPDVAAESIRAIRKRDGRDTFHGR